jgi:hypothetical protein
MMTPNMKVIISMAKNKGKGNLHSLKETIMMDFG